MKKLLFILLPLLFISCNSGYFTGIYDYEFKNNSSVTVSFTIENNDKTYTLQPKESIVITRDYNDNYTFLNNPRITTREECKTPYKYFYVYIDDIYFYNIKLFNPTNYDIIIKEKNGLLGDNYNDTLIIPAGQTITSKVYTYSPEFIALYKDTRMSANNIISVSFF